MAFSDWGTTDAENDTSSGINIAEGCPAANVNNWGRRIMAQLRSAFNPILDSFFASTTLAQARTALGVPEGSTSMTAFGALTNAANKLPYMTGSDAWSTTDLTSFARTLLDDGNAATVLATLGVSVSGGATSGSIALGTFKFQWKDGTAAANTTTAITYPSAFTSWSRAICTGGSTDPNAEENNPIVSSTSTTAATVANSRDESSSVTILAWGV